MQDQKETKKPVKKISSLIWGSISLFILLIGGICFWCTITKAPKAEWRNAYTRLPWEAAGVSISNAEASWKSSQGDARMELRAYCYPTCRLELNKAEGRGYISVRMFNSFCSQMGDRIRINYADGKFLPVQGNSLRVTENEAHIRLEDGFQNADLYKLHQINQSEKLWTVEVTCHPEGGEAEELGRLSILPHEL